MNIPVLALIGVGLIVVMPTLTNVFAQNNMRNVTRSFDDYGFCCYRWSSENLTIIGNINSIDAGMNESLAEQILTNQTYTMLNYSTTSEGTHIVAAQNNRTGGGGAMK